MNLFKHITAQEVAAFEKMLNGEKIPIKYYPALSVKFFLSLVEFCIRYIPGPAGLVLRRCYYKVLCKHLGKNVLIETGVILHNPWNIHIADFVFLDVGVIVNCVNSDVYIGKRVHIGPYSTIGGAAGITIGDYSGISSHCSLFTGSAIPRKGMAMSGPMIPKHLQAYYSSPIVLQDHCVVGSKSVVLPGVTMHEGSVAGALTLINRNTNAWSVNQGVPSIMKDRNRTPVELNEGEI